MTLFAFTLTEHRAEIVTDGLSYSPGAIDFDAVQKCDVFPAWDTAVTGSGPSLLGEAWKGVLAECTEAIRDLDQLHEYTPEALRELWRQVQEHRRAENVIEKGGGAEQGVVLHVGWSPERGRFVAYLYSVDDDGFEFFDLTEHRLFCQPTPWTYVPPEIPSTPKQWTQLVKAAHADWTLAAALMGHGLGKVYIGGEVVRTRLSRGVHGQQVIHRFPRQGAQWRKAMIANLSPEGQMGPCPCGSGLPYCACHLAPGAPKLAENCKCGSGKPFEACHYLPPDDPRVLAYYLAHLKDYEVLRPELAAAYRLARPADQWPPKEILRLRGSGLR